jgi:CRISPR-associated protein Cmr1
MTLNYLPIKLETITPIWTGGVDGKVDRLHATGIMGSLRWWYEVLVRSVGGTACDPTKHACLYNPPNDGLCDVCHIFGATGWARRFKVTISETNLQQRKPQNSTTGRQGNLEFSLSPEHPSPRNPKWYLPGDPLYGDVKLNITSTAPLDKSGNYLDSKIIGSLIQFIADWGSIGAKPQLGLGVVSVAERQSLVPLINHLKQIVERHEQNNDLNKDIDENLPCLQNMFFAKIHVSAASNSDTFNLKYDLRGMFREVYTGNDNLRHTIMGYVKGANRDGAKIMMSYPYEGGIIRIWGWIPRMKQAKPSRNDILSEVYYFLEDTYRETDFSFWRDYDPQRDGNMLNYLEQHFLEGAK